MLFGRTLQIRQGEISIEKISCTLGFSCAADDSRLPQTRLLQQAQTCSRRENYAQKILGLYAMLFPIGYPCLRPPFEILAKSRKLWIVDVNPKGGQARQPEERNTDFV